MSLSKQLMLERMDAIDRELDDGCPAYTAELLAERQRTHGSFVQNAAVSQKLKAAFRYTKNWPTLSDLQGEGLDMVAVKLARYLLGDPDYADHLDDIVGYIELMRRGE